MLSFLSLRYYLSDNYEQAAREELGKDYPGPKCIGNVGKSPLSVWYASKPDYLWGSIVHRARAQSDKLFDTVQKDFKYIEEGSFQSNSRVHHRPRMREPLHGRQGPVPHRDRARYVADRF